MPEQTQEQETRDEVTRLQAKLASITDVDIRLALQGRIDSLEHQLAHVESAPKAEAEKSTQDDLPPPTQEQIVQAENLIRQSRVEKMRGNSTQALTLMREAASVAPTAPAVLEALGDDLAERKQYKDAKETYKRALALQKENVGLERKYALLAIRSGSTGSFEDQLRRGSVDSPFPTSADEVASLKSAKILNLLLPGLGHLVIGKSTSGVLFISAWLACLIFIYLRLKDVQSLIRFAFGGQSGQVNLLVLIPILAALIVFICSIVSMGGGSTGADGFFKSGRKPVERPKPPVDLPFE